MLINALSCRSLAYLIALLIIERAHVSTKEMTLDHVCIGTDREFQMKISMNLINISMNIIKTVGVGIKNSKMATENRS